METELQHLFDLLTKALELEQSLNNLVTSFIKRIVGTGDLAEIKQLIAEFNKNYGQARAEHRRLLEEALGVVKEMIESGEEPPSPKEAKPVRPTQVASQFRSLMDSIQQDARKAREGESATTLKNLEIELKGLVVIQDEEAQIVPPSPGSQVDPGMLSTIRLSFGTIPVLRPQPEKQPPAPQSPSSPRTTSRRKPEGGNE